MSYGWMKLANYILHPLIVHALGLEYESAICFWNAFWMVYHMKKLVSIFESALNVSTWKVDFWGWFFFKCSIEWSRSARKWDSKMIWYIYMKHYVDELLMDEVCIFKTSSMCLHHELDEQFQYVFGLSFKSPTI